MLSTLCRQPARHPPPPHLIVADGRFLVVTKICSYKLEEGGGESSKPRPNLKIDINISYTTQAAYELFPNPQRIHEI